MEHNDRHEKSLDLDVTPGGPYADQRPYPPKKKSGHGPVWIGIAVVAVIIAATFFAFSGGREADRMIDSAAPVEVADSAPPDLPDKAADAVSFSPSPETIAAEEDASRNIMAEASAVEEAAPTGQKAAEKKPSETKPAEKKAAPKKQAETKKTETKTVETKAETAKADEAKAAEPKTPEIKTAVPEPAEAGTGVKQPSEAGETKAVASAEIAAEAKPVGEGVAEAKPTEAGNVDAKPAGAKTEAEAAEAKAAEPPAISDQWVVNISSTPDASESLKLLTQVMSHKVPGEEIYVYETAINGVPHHRIRIGFFADRDAAEAVGRRVKEEFKLSATPWAVQPTVDEVTRFKKN